MTEERKIIRRNRPNELERIIRALDKESKTAIDRLAKLCDSTDEKIALDASKSILKMIAEMKDQAEQRELQMMIAQHRIGTLKGNVQEDNTPIVCFDQIQEIS